MVNKLFLVCLLLCITSLSSCTTSGQKALPGFFWNNADIRLGKINPVMVTPGKFTVFRFNFRGVGRSQGEYDQGVGELSDAAAALDYLQSMNNNSKHCWVAGFSFGAWIGMQLLMRRPEITGFISASPPANMYDFSFLAPCPSSGLIINGTEDRIAPPADTVGLVEKLHEQKGITITHTELEGSGHFFEDRHMDDMIGHVSSYVKRRLTETSR